MKAVLPCVFGLLVFLPVSTPAEEANGLRLTAQKTVLEKDTTRGPSYYYDSVSKALGLKVNARNISFKDLSEGTLEYIVLVQRWGYSPPRIEKYTGTEPLPALRKGAEANLTVGRVPLGGYEAGGNRTRYQDSIEGWQIIAKHNGAETIKITSTSGFEPMLKKAVPGKLPKEDDKAEKK
jgi:hypothetical protein